MIGKFVLNKKKLSPKKAVFYVLFYLIIGVGAFVCIYPLIFTFMSALFSSEEFILSMDRLTFFPIADHPTLENYLMFFKSDSEVFIGFINSLVRTAFNVIMGCMMAFVTGFCFSRLRFRGRNTIFIALLAVTMLPGTITLAPTYIMYKMLGLYDTYWVYFITGPCVNIMGGFMVMLSFEKIPRELDEAAKIDGAGHIRILCRVLFPLQLPIITYLAITTAIGTWNDWFTPFFFTESGYLQTLPSALSRLATVVGGTSSVNYPLTITLSLGTTIPPLIIFFIFQRYIIEGISNIGVKG